MVRDSGRRPGQSGENPVIKGILVLSAVAGIIGVMAQLKVWPFDGAPGPAPSTGRPTPPGGGVPTCQSPALSLSKGSGPSGTHVVVNGTGFPSNQSVEMRFHTELLAPSQTSADGSFKVEIVVPGTFDSFIGQQFTIRAVSTPSVCSKDAPFKLTG